MTIDKNFFIARTNIRKSAEKTEPPFERIRYICERQILETIMNCIRNLMLTGALALLAAVSARAQEGQVPIYLNTAYSFEERATDLVSRLTLEEKQSLLGNNMAAVPRLGLKNYNVWSEALHGVLSGANPAVGILGPSSFPNSVAIGSSWDPAVAERMASAIADEARAIYATGTKGLTFWSPVVEPVRDPRWGRTGESYGEDPFLAAEIARGYQKASDTA